MDGSWPDVVLAAVNMIQVVLLAWIARDVSDAKHNRKWRDRRDDADRLEDRNGA
jgi:hypothetical protein